MRMTIWPRKKSGRIWMRSLRHDDCQCGSGSRSRSWRTTIGKGLEDDNVPVTIPPTQRSLSNVRLKSDCARYGPPLFLHWQHWGWQHFGAAKRQMQTSNCWLVCLIRAWQS